MYFKNNIDTNTIFKLLSNLIFLFRPLIKLNVQLFQELKKHNVKDVVCVCDPTYKTAKLTQEGIRVLVSL